jgi:hypothetical protein
MNKIKALQKRLEKEEITKAEYAAQLQDLLDDEAIDQDAFDEAKDFEPEEDEKIYSQAEMDAAILMKARTMVKKELKKAGYDLTDVQNKDLLSEVSKIAQIAKEKGNLDASEQEIADLRNAAKSAEKLQGTVGRLTIENTVLKSAGKYNPVNPAQIVRALNADYADKLEYDEDEQLIPASVDRALKAVQKAEPNLFAAPANPDEDHDQTGQQGGGKPPGGSSQSKSQKDKQAEANKARMAELLNLPK